VVVLAVLGASAGAHADPPRDPARVGTAEGLWALGAAGIVTGVTLGLVARADYHHAFDQGSCAEMQDVKVCDQVGYDETHRAVTLGDVGTAFAVGGSLLAVAGAVVYLTAPRGHAVTPVVTRDSAGLALSGRF
jgi:hypothetical protein